MFKLLQYELTHPERIAELGRAIRMIELKGEIVFDKNVKTKINPELYNIIFLHDPDIQRDNSWQNKPYEWGGKTNLIIYSEGYDGSATIQKTGNFNTIRCNYKDLLDGIEEFLREYIKCGRFELSLLVSKHKCNTKLHIIRHNILNSLTSVCYSIDNAYKYFDTDQIKSVLGSLAEAIRKENERAGDQIIYIKKLIELYGKIFISADKDKTTEDTLRAYERVLDDLNSLTKKLESTDSEVHAHKLEGTRGKGRQGIMPRTISNLQINKEEMIETKKNIMDFVCRINEIVIDADRALE